MPNQLKLLLDMDGVIVDYCKGVCELHNRPNPYVHLVNRGRFDMAQIWNIKQDNFFEGCEHDFWANLDFMPDGPKILEMVESKFGLENICLLSSPTRNLTCISGKLDWINKHIPQYSRSFLFGPQKHFCAHIDNVLIDDKDENVDDFIRHGGRAFLLPRHWNRAHHYSVETLYRLQDFLDRL